MQLIMVILRFTLQSIHLNIPLNLFQIRTSVWLNKLTMMKYTNSWNSSTQSMIMIIWILTSRWFSIEYWLLPLQNFIQPLLCYFINMEEQMLLSQIAYHTFLCTSQPISLWNWLMKTQDMPKKLGLFYAIVLTVLLYIRWYQFIIFQVTLPTPSH